MQRVFNLWLNIMAGSPSTLTVSRLPFHTLLTLAPLKKGPFHSAHFAAIGQIGEQAKPAGSQLHLREGWRLYRSRPPSPPLQPSFPGGEKEKGLGKRPCFFSLSSELWGRKRENSHCRASGTLYLSVGWKAWQENERMRGLFTELGSMRRGRRQSEIVHYFPLN